MRKFNIRDIFYDGLKKYRNGDFYNAKLSFQISLNDTNYRDISAFYLIKIDVYLEKMAEAKEKLAKYFPVFSEQYKFLFGIISFCEYNFDISIKNFLEAIEIQNNNEDKIVRAKSMLELSKVYLSNGNLEESLDLIDQLDNIIDFEFRSKLVLISIIIDLIKGNYESAKEKLNKIKGNKKDKRKIKEYERASLVVNYLLGRDVRSVNVSEYNKYYRDIILGREDVLLEHLSLHKKRNLPKSGCCFYDDLDLRKLLEEVREKVKNTNPMYKSFEQIYKLCLDNPIGFYGDKELFSVEVIKVPFVDSIVTVFPIDVTPEFDMEGKRRSLDIRRN